MDRPRGDRSARRSLPPSGMTVAAIDIGTNTVLLLVARISADGTILPLLQEQRIPRLGAGVDARRLLLPEAMQRVASVLEEYRSMIRTLPVDTTTVCATSAVRDANNRDEFLGLIRESTGIDVEVLTGEEEALWSFRGAISGTPGIRLATVVDIGGGSTEIISGDEHGINGRLSIDIGAVRLTERFLADDPPTPAQLQECTRAIREGLRPMDTLATAGSTVIGVAGTATTLALLHQGFKKFDQRAVSGYRLPIGGVMELASTLSAMRSTDIARLSSALEGRADIITAGTLILRTIMERLGCSEILVSERGVRYGLALREWERRGGIPAATHRG